MAHQMNRSASASEVRSWDASLAALAADLERAGLGGVEVLAEYQLPLSSKRVDVVLAGEHPRRAGPSYVVVELKQWTHASLFEDEPELVVQPTYGPRPVLHPVAQVRGYVEYLLDFLGVLHGTTDPVFPLPHGRALAAEIPGARLVELVGMGHEVPPPALWDEVVAAIAAHTDGAVRA